MLRIAICDSEKRTQTQLLDYIAKDPDIEDDYMTECFDDVEVVKNRIDAEDFKFNLAFIEVGDKEQEGFKLARYIREQNLDIDIIFLAGTIDYVEEAFRYRAFNYLVKPVEFKRFQYEIRQYFQELKNYQRDVLTVSVHGKEKSIPLYAISYCVSNGRKIGVFLGDGEEEIWYYGKLSELEERLEKHDFFRCHQSYLVSGSKIESIDSQYIYIGKESIPISRKYAETVKTNWERLNRKRQKDSINVALGNHMQTNLAEEDATWIGNTVHLTRKNTSEFTKYGLIVGLRGDRQGVSYRIYEGEDIAIGRDPNQCKIVISYGMISRKHCMIRFDVEQQCFYVRDTSKNGTYVVGMGRIQSDCWVRVEKDSILRLVNDEYTFILI